MLSSIAKLIDTTDWRAQYDGCVKRLLSEKIILAWILKECVEEFEPFSINKIMMDCIEGDVKVSVYAVDQDELDYDESSIPSQMDGRNIEDSSIQEGTVYYDIRFNAIVPDTKEPVQLIINIEAQKDDKTTYPIIKRAIYYLSRMISAQKNKVFTNSHYENIRKVYSIWIQMNVDEDVQNSITAYRFTEDNVVGSAREKKSDYDLLTAIMLKLGNVTDDVEQPILRLLDVLLSAEKQPEEKKQVLEQDFNIPMSVSISKEVNEMCNLGQGLIEMTEVKTSAKFIIKLMKEKNYSLEEALEFADVSDEVRERVVKIVDEMLASPLS